MAAGIGRALHVSEPSRSEERMGATSGTKDPAGLPPARAVRLEDEVAYVGGSVVSRTVAGQKGGSVTLFAFDAGQELSEHTAPFDAFVQVLDGRAEITVGGSPVEAAAGETVVMPANVPHALRAKERFKMLLTMVRS
jgi:quercetin dioxygenase-like cupin family protein